MNLNPDVLDAADEDSRQPDHTKWWIQLLVFSLIFPFVGGILIGLTSQARVADSVFSFLLLGLFTLAVIFTGKYLALSSLKITDVRWIFLSIVQMYLLLGLMFNCFYFFELLLEGRTLSEASIQWPDFNSINELLFAILLISIYSPWVALSIRIHRRASWPAFLVLAMVYSFFIIWGIFVQEWLGPV